MVTTAQKAALKWLRNRGGDGVFDKTLCLIAAGERAGVSRSTWAALHKAGLVEIYTPERAKKKHGRCRVTEAGRALKLYAVTEAHCKDLGEDPYV